MSVIAGSLEVLAFFAISYAVGRLVIAVLQLEPDPLTRAGSAVIGASAMAIQLWIYGAVHIPWWAVLLLAPWVVIGIVFRHAVVAAVMTDAADARLALGRLRSLDPLSAGLVAFIAATLGLYLISLVGQPLIGWDAIAMWLFKAKMFFDSGSIDLTQLPVTPGNPYARHPGYPPLVPLVIDAFWVLVGRVDDSLGKTVGFLFLVSVLWSVVALLLPLIGRRLTVMVALILVAMPALQTSFVFPYYMGYADYVVAALMTMSVCHLYRAAALGRDQDSALAIVYAALAAFTKNEGLTFFVVVVAVIGIAGARLFLTDRERPSRRLLLIAGASALPLLAWQLYIRIHGLAGEVPFESHPQFGAVPSRVHTIALFYWHWINRFDDYPWLAVAWLLATALALISGHRSLLLAWLVITLEMGFLGLALVFTPLGVSYELTTAADRLVLQVTPMLVLLLALGLRGWDAAEAVGEKAPLRSTRGGGPRRARTQPPADLVAIGKGLHP